MVIDGAKGIEAQTRKLFEVCRRRAIPIFTFVNKLDRPTKDPLALLDEIERVLKIGAFPVNWPLGTGFEFRGVFDRLKKEVHFFEYTTGGAYRAPVEISSLSDPVVLERLDSGTHEALLEELSMLDIAGEAFDTQQVLEGKLTPVFFGSARNNFGVQLLMDGFLDHAGPPRPRMRRQAESCPWSRMRSPGSSSRSRQTWIPATATASRSSASARESSSAT